MHKYFWDQVEEAMNGLLSCGLHKHHNNTPEQSEKFWIFRAQKAGQVPAHRTGCWQGVK